MNVSVNDSRIDASAIRILLVEGETGVRTINFMLDAGLTGLVWRMRGVNASGGMAQSDLLTATETATAVTVEWTVAEEFTAAPGPLQLTLVGTNAGGTEIAKALGTVIVAADASMSPHTIITESLYEQLIAEANAAASAAATSAQSAAASAAACRRPLNGLYDGVDLSTVFADFAACRAAVAAGDFSQIKVGDYWPVRLTGPYRDYGSYTVPAGTTYYSDDALTTVAGTRAALIYASYYSATAVSLVIEGTTYYAAIGDCLPYYVRTLSNALMLMEFAAINPYCGYGDTPITQNHVLMISRDCLPNALRMRKNLSVWEDAMVTNPSLGSALYKTLNDADNGIISLLAETDIGQYVFAGPNGAGMRYYGETKASGALFPTGASWLNRGKLFLPLECEIWGEGVYADKAYCKGIANQIALFSGSTRHIAKGLGNGGSPAHWWCASANGESTGAFCRVGIGNEPSSTGSGSPMGVPLCFLIA